MRIVSGTGAAVLGILLGGVAGIGTARADDIVFNDGRVRENVTVRQVKYNEVVFSEGGIDLRESMDRVRDILYDPMPEGLSRGHPLRARGGEHYAEAIRMYEGVANDRRARDHHKSDARFWIGECYRLMGEPRRAVEAYQALVGTEDRYAPQAALGLGQVQLAAREPAQAREAFQRLAGGGFGQAYRPVGTLWVAKTYEVEGKYNDALQQYESLRLSGTGSIRIAADAGKARCLVHLGRVDEAARLVESVDVAGEGDPAVQASFHNVRGLVLATRAKGAGGEDARALWTEALMSHLKAAVLYPDNAEEEARGLLGASRCFAALGREDRRQQLLAEVRARFPTYAPGDE